MANTCDLRRERGRARGNEGKEQGGTRARARPQAQACENEARQATMGRENKARSATKGARTGKEQQATGELRVKNQRVTSKTGTQPSAKRHKGDRVDRECDSTGTFDGPHLLNSEQGPTIMDHGSWAYGVRKSTSAWHQPEPESLT